MHFKGLMIRICTMISAVSLLPAVQPAEAAAQFPQSDDNRIAAMTAGATIDGEPDMDGVDEEALLYKDIPLGNFRVSNIAPNTKTELDYTDMWYSRWDDCHYLFLPATADRSKLTITLETAEGEKNASVTLNKTAVESGKQTDLLDTSDTFEMTVNGKSCGELRVMQSNLGAIYLKTAHGGVDYLDKNYNTEETGSILMLDENGVTQYDGEIGALTRHGNSSWDYSIKKPYNLKLPEKQNLYGMGKAKKWVLLGNNLDHSMLRNALTTEICNQANMQYTLDYRFVDLYADGSYRGTYQLYEKAQIQKQRINIRDLGEETEKLNDKPLKEYDRIHGGTSEKLAYELDSTRYYDIPNDPEDITGGYLIQFQLWNRYNDSPKKVKSGFVTKRGTAVQVNEPEYATKKQIEYISQFVQELEDALYSETGKNSLGKHYSDYVDVDSFIKGYLVQEFSMNPDGQNTSFFFWKDSDRNGDGKLHYGPAWDFDLAYANFSRSYEDMTGKMNDAGTKVLSYNSTNPCVFYIMHQTVSGYGEKAFESHGQEGVAKESWFWMLLSHEKQHIQDVWFSDFAKQIRALISSKGDEDSWLTKLGESIEPSAKMNSKRWNMTSRYMYTTKSIVRKFGVEDGNSPAECVATLRKFAQKREAFISGVWGEEKISEMREAVKALRQQFDPAHYDEDGLYELDGIIEKATIQCGLTNDPEKATEYYKKAVASMDEVPHKELSGDFNDDFAVTIEDAKALLNYVVAKQIGIANTVKRVHLQNGDVNKDGRLDIDDAKHILCAAVAAQIGLSYPLPVVS